MRWTAAACVSLAAMSCARFGYTDRVLHRVPSPDGAMVAVCRERPEFDGPGYRVWLERRAGTLLRPLYESGDADPCDEVAWSPSSRWLAVTTTGVGRIRVIDVRAGIDEPGDSWAPSRTIELSTGVVLRRVTDVAFIDDERIAFDQCPYDLAVQKRTGIVGCTGERTRRQRWIVPVAPSR